MERDVLIEKYIQGRLAEEELELFNELMKTDPAFQDDVSFHSDLKKVTEAEDDESFRTMLSEFEEKAEIETDGDRLKEIPSDHPSESESGEPIVRRLPTKWLVAASIVVLVGLGYFFTVLNQPTTQEMFEQNFIPYRNVVHSIERNSQEEDLKTKAFVAYSKGEYELSIDLFSLLYTNEQESYYLFYKANALISQNRSMEAIPLLKEYLETAGEFKDESKWYLALAYLQLGDEENAKELLEELMSSGTYKVEEAQELLNDLE